MVAWILFPDIALGDETRIFSTGLTATLLNAKKYDHRASVWDWQIPVQEPLLDRSLRQSTVTVKIGTYLREPIKAGDSTWTVT